MQPRVTQEQRDWNRKAAFIEKFGDLYLVDPIWRNMVDRTIYLTPDQIHESMGIIGGTLHKGNY